MSETTIWCAKALLDTGWQEQVLITVDRKGQISSVQLKTPVDNRNKPDHVLTGVVIPGMPNLHSHGFQRLMAGLTGNTLSAGDSFWSWRQKMYELANRLSPDQIEICNAWLYAQMLAAGYTACAEFHYLHHQPGGKPYTDKSELSQRVLAAAAQTGIRLTLLPVLYQVSGFGQSGAEPHQLRFRHELEDYLNLLQSCSGHIAGNERFRLGVAPHSLRAVPADILRHLLAALPDPVMPVHIHVAEQPAEVRDSKDFLKARPVQWLLDNMPVTTSWCLVHATHMLPDEMVAAARSGAVAGLCPSTEADLGDGMFDTRAWLDQRGAVGIGSDSNVMLDPAAELRMLEWCARLQSGRRNVLGSEAKPVGRFLYEAAAKGGAQAIGQPVGVLTAGMAADIVELNLVHPLLAGKSGDQILETFVMAGGSEMVRSVFVCGEQVVAAGSHRDAMRLERAYLQLAQELNGS